MFSLFGSSSNNQPNKSLGFFGFLSNNFTTIVTLIIIYFIYQKFSNLFKSDTSNNTDLDNIQLKLSKKMAEDKKLKATTLHAQKAETLYNLIYNYRSVRFLGTNDYGKQVVSEFKGMNANDVLLVFNIYGIRTHENDMRQNLVERLKFLYDVEGYTDYWEKIRPYFIASKLST